MKGLERLEELTKPLSKGPHPSFTKYHLLKAIELIGEEKTIGRSALSTRLKIGTGVARTLITHLQKEGLITIVKSGCQLTNEGNELFKELISHFPKKAIIERSQYSLGQIDFGILVKNAAARVNLGIEQRDAAVIAGGRGAVTLIFKNGKLSLPPANGKPEEIGMASKILNTFNPEENDVIIICGADTQEEAESGARAAAWTLVT